MNFDAAKLTELLKIMSDAGVDKFTLDGLTVEFGVIRTAPAPLTPETVDDRYKEFKQALMEANQNQQDIEDWST